MKLCECLIGKVGLSPRCDAGDPCERYIDRLPGITRSKFESLTDTDRATYIDIMNQVEVRAIESVHAFTSMKIASAFRTRTVVKDIRTGYWKQPITALPAAPELRGEYIDLRGSDNTELYIESVQLYVGNQPQTINVSIFDIETPTLLDSFSQAVTVNDFVTIPIERSYRADRLFIAYDATTLQSAQTTNNSSDYFNDVCNECHCSTSGRCARLDTSDGIQYDNLVFGGLTGCSGMIVKYQICCSPEAWICKNKKNIIPMLYYKMGIEFFIEILASDRINCATLISAEKLDALMSYCEGNLRKLEKAFDSTIQPDDPVCFLCRSKISKAIVRL